MFKPIIGNTPINETVAGKILWYNWLIIQKPKEAPLYRLILLQRLWKEQCESAFKEACDSINQELI